MDHLSARNTFETLVTTVATLYVVPVPAFSIKDAMVQHQGIERATGVWN
jgi:hypothetical protein